MKICRICQSFPKEGVINKADGVGITTFFLSVAQSKTNSVTVLTSGDDDSEEVYNGIKIYRFKKERPFSLKTGPRMLKKMDEINQKSKFDVIHVHNPLFFSRGLKSRFGSALILTIHGSVLHHKKVFSLRRVDKALKNYFNVFYLGKRLSKEVDRVVCFSKESLEEVVKYYGLPRSKLDLIESGVDIKQFNPPDKPHKGFNLLSVGRFVKLKGFEYLIMAMPKILEVFPNTKLHIVGYTENDDSYANIINLVKDLKLEKSVIPIGGTTYDKVKEFYYTSDVYVQPSLSEGMPKTIIESMACGKPIIATKIAGFKDVIKDGQNGFLVNTRDPKDLAEKILFLLKNKDVRLRIGEENRRFSKKFDWSEIAKKYSVVYNKALKGL